MRRYNAVILYLLVSVLVVAASQGNWINAYLQLTLMFIGIISSSPRHSI
jgi:hypothetical protein